MLRPDFGPPTPFPLSVASEPIRTPWWTRQAWRRDWLRRFEGKPARGDGLPLAGALTRLPTGVGRSEVAQQPRVKDRIQVVRTFTGNCAVPVQAGEFGGNTAGFDLVVPWLGPRFCQVVGMPRLSLSRPQVAGLKYTC